MRLSVLSEGPEVVIGGNTRDYIIVSINGRKYRYWANPYHQGKFRFILTKGSGPAVHYIKRASDGCDRWDDESGRWVPCDD